MSWALAQIVTTVPGNIDARDQTEVHLNFYGELWHNHDSHFQESTLRSFFYFGADIFVRHAFGNYRDILREASYSPAMAEHLTYEKSKSHSYVFREEDKVRFLMYHVMCTQEPDHQAAVILLTAVLLIPMRVNIVMVY